MLFVPRASVEGHVERLELGLSPMEQWLREQTGRQIHEVTILMTECIAIRLGLHVHGLEVVVGSPAPPHMQCGSVGRLSKVLDTSAVS